MIKVPDFLRTDRLILRRHHLKDLDAFVGFLAHPTATLFMTFTSEQRTRDGARQMLEFVIASYESDSPILSLTIADPQSDAYLGSCGLQALREAGEVEIYYTVIPEYQNQGLATEAVGKLLSYAFQHTEVRRVVAHVVPENVSAVRVAEKLGFVDEGSVQIQARSGELGHEALSGRRYVLERPLERESS